MNEMTIINLKGIAYLIGLAAFIVALLVIGSCF